MLNKIGIVAVVLLIISGVAVTGDIRSDQSPSAEAPTQWPWLADELGSADLDMAPASGPDEWGAEMTHPTPEPARVTTEKDSAPSASI